jgi:hypothetical protein
MKKKQIINIQSAIIFRYEEIEKLLKNQEKIRFKAVEIMIVYFQIERLKRSLKKTKNSISVKTQNPD